MFLVNGQFSAIPVTLGSGGRGEFHIDLHPQGSVHRPQGGHFPPIFGTFVWLLVPDVQKTFPTTKHQCCLPEHATLPAGSIFRTLLWMHQKLSFMCFENFKCSPPNKQKKTTHTHTEKKWVLVELPFCSKTRFGVPVPSVLSPKRGNWFKN